MKPYKLWSLFLSACLGICALQTYAQEVLTLEAAVEIALENNYEIRLAENDLKVDSLGVSPGFAGMLPRVFADASGNNSTQNISQTRSDGSVVELDNAKNNNLNYGVGLDWTIFDGLSMFARYDRLKELQKLGKAELQSTVLGRASDVMITYYDLVQQQQQLTALDSTLVISQQRVDLADNRFSIGKASKLEVLNAQVDLNTDRTLQIRQIEMYANTKIRLNEIMARDTQIDFKVNDEVLIANNLKLDELERLASTQNPELQAQLIAKRISELELKQIKRNRYPVITANTGYNFSDSEFSLGFATENRAQGWNYGFTASIDIFNGSNQNRNEKIAKLQIETTTIAIEQQTQTINSQLQTAFQTYITNLSLIELETKNEEIAKENLDITLAKYKIGTIPTIEFRTAQLNYINATLRLSNAIYLAKLSEITLKQLSGNLSLQ
ncbi:TolC family protein [Subsaximicrobium wynnwilliamsii]|uniref:TolC family protein n=1 Tax=Subsaximicrobium wynnwilliamsii TaxID=291179 RepID=A0A5C6ZLA4_9FLAO|nr:TolC family protein [Subsaximicrobium wynnwilliamsii]TXD84951.1 TolC family protein [Subsaximicrobium wynnwilliamsii]TXD90622.1 TolC family protein [Subsaximicrobium wynnwilliamsii]TXE05096.1 TolC family protein [Subsaximicrobium wynnwilliamsii]